MSFSTIHNIILLHCSWAGSPAINHYLSLCIHSFVNAYVNKRYGENFRKSMHVLLGNYWGAQWLSGRVLDSRPNCRGLKPHRRHCVVVLEKDTFILAQYWFNPGRSVPL